MDKESQASTSTTASYQNKYVPVLLVVLLIVVLGGFYYHTKKTTKQNVMGTQAHVPHASEMSGKIDSAMMKATTPAPLTDQQRQELVTGTSSATTKKIFTFTAGNFWFAPDKITVNRGDKVTINFVVKNGFHDFVIDQFKVKVGPVAAGKTVSSVTFTADTAGTYEFYCDIDHHRQKGQMGTLIVQ